VLDREVEGERLVTRRILEQTRRNGDDLTAIKTRLDRVEEIVDGLDLPVILAETLWDMPRERDGR